MKSYKWLVNRFGYDTDNQFRAERRFPNGTVAGYYGYVQADGKPIRVKYGSVDNLGFSAMQEIIPVAFPETPTTEPNEQEFGSGDGSDISAQSVDSIPMTNEEKKVILLPPLDPIIDDEKESVSIDAIDYLSINDESRSNQGFKRFSYPKIDIPDLPKRTARSLESESKDLRMVPIPIQRAAQRRIILDRTEGEPTIMYAEPIRFTKTVRYTVE